MDRGLRAQLSPNETTILLKIASAEVKPESLRSGDLEQLRALGLIEIRDGGWHLTKMGVSRAASVVLRN